MRKSILKFKQHGGPDRVYAHEIRISLFKPKEKPEESSEEKEEEENKEGSEEMLEKPTSRSMQTSVSANFNELNPDIVHSLFRNSKDNLK